MTRQHARNQAVAAAYRTATMAGVADQFGMSESNVRRILAAEGALLSYEERCARYAEANRRRAADPDHRAKVSAGTADWWQRRKAAA